MHWEEEVDHSFDGARGLEYFRGLPGLMEDHTTEPGLIELLLTLATEATDPQHPARDWAVERYARVTNLGVSYLREARDLGEIGPMTDEQIEMEARGVFALMDGLQLQWLLDPSLPVVQMFQAQLDMILERWTRGAKTRRRTPRPGLSASGVPADRALTAGGELARPSESRPSTARCRSRGGFLNGAGSSGPSSGPDDAPKSVN